MLGSFQDGFAGRRRSAAGFGGVVAIAALLVTACESSHPVEHNPKSPGELSVAVVARVLKDSKLPHGRADLMYPAEIHTAALQEFARNEFAIRRLSKADQCKSIEMIILHQIPAIKAASRVNDDLWLEGVVQGTMRHIGCQTKRLSLFDRSASLRPSATGSSNMNTVTGAFMNYESAFDQAVNSAATPQQAIANLDAVVASAQSQVPAGDYEVLVGLAQFGASSLNYWDVYLGGGGGGGGGVPMMSMMGPCGTVCRIGWSDLGGAVFTAGVAFNTGAVPPCVRIVVASPLG